MLIIGGGIAAYKCLELIRRLRERGIGVRAVMTRAAQEFVTPLSVGALTNDRVFTELFDLNDEREIGHIRLSREADLIVVAPATADLLAKMAGGHADDLATCVLLATDKPVLVAPAMNPRMWLQSGHPAQRGAAAGGRHAVRRSQRRRDGRARRGRPRPPGRGAGAGGGDRGAAGVPLPLVREAPGGGESDGRDPPIPNPPRKGGGIPLTGRHVLVTSGPTHEPIDPVRYIANRSSGKQGAAIAAEAARARRRGDAGQRPDQSARSRRREGGPGRDRAGDAGGRARGAARRHRHLRRRRRRLARGHAASEKIKKGGKAAPRLELVENPDILKTIAPSAPAGGRRW